MKEAPSRIVIALVGAVTIHATAAIVLGNSLRYENVDVVTNSIEIVTEGTLGGPSAPPVSAPPAIAKKPAPHFRAYQMATANARSLPATPTAQENSGQTGTGHASGAAVNSYLAGVRERLSSAIHVPRGTRSNLQAVLKMTLHETGDVTAPSIDQTSGSPDFDRLVLEALDRAKPFPAFTKELAGVHELTLKVPVVYRLNR